MRIRLDVAYDGTDFHGWAAQPGLRTVRASCRRRWPRCCGSPTVDADLRRPHRRRGARPRPGGARRPRRRLPRGRRSGWPGGSTASSPADVRVHRAVEAPDGLRRAVLRALAALRLPGRRPARRSSTRCAAATCWPGRGRSTRTLMNAAAPALLGEHDFASFCKQREGATTIRTLLDLRWSREPDGLLVAHVRADAFCHSMVRSLVGCLLAVGEGRRPADWAGEVLAAGAARLRGGGRARARADPRGGRLPARRRARRARVEITQGAPWLSRTRTTTSPPTRRCRSARMPVTRDGLGSRAGARPAARASSRRAALDIGTAVLFRETAPPAGGPGPRPRLRVRRDRAGASPPPSRPPR